MMRFIGIVFLGLLIGCGQTSPPSTKSDETSSSGASNTPTEKQKESDGWREDGDPISDSPNIKSKDGFGAQLFLTKDESFFSNWNRPDAPKLARAEKVRRDTPIFTVIILAGMGTDSEGVANVTYDIVIRNPDGSIYSDETGLIGWNREHPGSPQDLQLAEGYMGIVIEDEEPNGTYTVEATVHDHIKNVTLTLETKFHVDE